MLKKNPWRERRLIRLLRKRDSTGTQEDTETKEGINKANLEKEIPKSLTRSMLNQRTSTWKSFRKPDRATENDEANN